MVTVNKTRRTKGCMEKTVLMVLLAVFGALVAVLTLLSQPGAELLAVCGAVVVLCAAGVMVLYRRPVWQAELTEEGIQCHEQRGGEWKLLEWSAYRRAYELRTSRGDSCLMLTTGERTRRELTQVYRRCSVRGLCVMDGCACVAGCMSDEAAALLEKHHIQRAPETLRLFLV